MEHVAGSSATTKDKVTKWRVLFRKLSEEYGYPPQVIGQWTYYQCRMMVCEEWEITGRMKVSPERAGQIAAKGPVRRQLLRSFRGR